MFDSTSGELSNGGEDWGDTAKNLDGFAANVVEVLTSKGENGHPDPHTNPCQFLEVAGEDEVTSFLSKLANYEFLRAWKRM